MTRCIIVFVFGLFPFLIKGQDSGSQTIIGTKKPVAFGFSAGGYLTAIDESYKSPSFDLVPIIRVSPKRIGFFFETGIGYRFYRHKFDIWPGPGFFCARCLRDTNCGCRVRTYSNHPNFSG